MPTEASIIQAFDLAREAYEALGVDVDRALVRLAQTPISLHCWQGDDVGGFDGAAEGCGYFSPSEERSSASTRRVSKLAALSPGSTILPVFPPRITSA